MSLDILLSKYLSDALLGSNAAMAIKGCRTEEGKLVHNRRDMQTIKESLYEGYCDVSGHVTELDHVGK